MAHHTTPSPGPLEVDFRSNSNFKGKILRLGLDLLSRNIQPKICYSRARRVVPLHNCVLLFFIIWPNLYMCTLGTPQGIARIRALVPGTVSCGKRQAL